MTAWLAALGLCVAFYALLVLLAVLGAKDDPFDEPTRLDRLEWDEPR